MIGVVGIARCIWNDPDFKDEPFTEREAFMWLVCEASWKDRQVRGKYGPVQLKRSEFCHSVRFMAGAWGWKKGRAERFLKRLQKRDMLRDTKRDNTKVYSIKNYNKFQIVGLPNQDSDRDKLREKNGRRTGTGRDKLEEGNKVISNRSDGFEVFWEAYPRKVAKGQARKSYYASALKRASPESLLAGAKNYAKSRKGEDAKFTMHASTWLNGECWLDEIIPDKPTGSFRKVFEPEKEIEQPTEAEREAQVKAYELIKSTARGVRV